eukprot:CAMPEP_0197586434 /NCGR_PEP_ID=MMETSP1326-20131121/8404_1 /TAXON_ID=1155430 /ORGANISM="Genus nov. species nov., Strain RCC2288" /LENGTH=70 /DNA_ID=CAMNT_0043151059 /DNA_START=111 /DNA_END=320 /DNA_ORIENTATION=+
MSATVAAASMAAAAAAPLCRLTGAGRAVQLYAGVRGGAAVKTVGLMRRRSEVTSSAASSASSSASSASSA